MHSKHKNTASAIVHPVLRFVNESLTARVCGPFTDIRANSDTTERHNEADESATPSRARVLRGRAEERLDGSPVLLDLAAEFEKLGSETAAPVAGHRQITLFKGNKSTVAIFAFDIGGGMREHSAPGVVTVHVLSGLLEINVAGETHRIAAQSVLVIPPRARHDVKALEDSQMLLNVSLTKP